MESYEQEFIDDAIVNVLLRNIPIEGGNDDDDFHADNEADDLVRQYFMPLQAFTSHDISNNDDNLIRNFPLAPITTDQQQHRDYHKMLCQIGYGVP